MESLPVDLLKQVHPVYGGAIGFGFWVAFQVWRAWKEWQKEKRDNRAADAAHEAAREGRKTSGFAQVDASRDKQIQSLDREIERLNEAMDVESRRHRNEMDRMDGRLAAKVVAMERLEADKERGWDLARECRERLVDMRHDANNRIANAYAAGKFGGERPAEIPPVPLLNEMAGKRPPAE